MLRGDQLSEAQKMMKYIRGTSKGIVFKLLVAHHLLCTSDETALQVHGLTNPSENISVELHSPNQFNLTDQLLC